MAAFGVLCFTTARAVSAYDQNADASDRSKCRARAPSKHLKARSGAVASFAGTCGGNGWRPGGPGVRRGFRPGQSAKRALRGVALDIAPPPDHSDQRIDPDARKSNSKPRERPLFSSPLLTCFALARARSGPDARDEGLTGETTVSGNARLAVRQRHAAAKKRRFRPRTSNQVDPWWREEDFGL